MTSDKAMLFDGSSFDLPFNDRYIDSQVDMYGAALCGVH